MTARREKGKFLVFRVFAEMCIGSQSARGMAMFAEPLPRIISRSRGLVYPRTGGLRGFSICRLRVNRTSDSSPSGEYSRRRRCYIIIMSLHRARRGVATAALGAGDLRNHDYW